MTQYEFSDDEARRLIRLMVDDFDRPSGLGDVVLRIEVTSGEVIFGHLVEQEGESSPDGVLLNDGGRAIRYSEMVGIGMQYSE